MKIQTVNCLVGVRENPSHDHFTLQVYKTGEDAIPVTELPILMGMNGVDSISEVSSAGEIETSKQDEFNRLRAKYPKSFMLAYPSAGALMPKDIDGVGLEAWQIVASKVNAPKSTTPDERAALRARLAELNYTIPFGNHGAPRLREMVAEAEARGFAKATA